mmetsp:Transcript_6076/g.11612  ORF Transcript_6076/g.11612 Transcript_6076/m.11612 type:complete len:955 (+) Transcript_6076:182-3046(+)|eukprot:CAMPEP_0114235290 /NCGR_PEP_ID=MMETSP0058-20121206/6169_1 /TAXON_ID=36894 /ORGANISM="Pyramimonas parkeae, CCMP726" /LENGTH=954 /DNA_ID=CAMNT_0001347037 /DNA_START=175 /DNA_END=3039 /DNA_ORIENTATION=+
MLRNPSFKMFFAVCVVVLLGTRGFIHSEAKVPDLQNLECGLHSLAMRFAAQRVTALHADPEARQAVARALRLKQLCGSTPEADNDLIHQMDDVALADAPPQMHRAERVTPPGGSDFYVAVDGNDAGAGSLSDPFRTLRRASEAVSAARSAARGTPQRAVVYLRGGAHFLRDTLALGAEHSNTLWTAYADEKVVLSGGTPLRGLRWSKFTDDILVSELEPLDAAYAESLRSMPSYTNRTRAQDELPEVDAERSAEHFWGPPPTTFNTLFVGGKRQIRARHPNGDPDDLSGLCFSKADHPEDGEGCAGWARAAGGHGGQLPAGRKVARVSFGPDRGEAPALSHCPQCKLGGFGRFFYDVYDPPEGHPVYNCPVSFQANNSYVSYWSDLLDRPAGMRAVRGAASQWSPSPLWAHPETGIVHMIHPAGWGGWQFQLTRRSRRALDDVLHFGYGGHQEARGGPVESQKFYVENIFEELDSPGEWFYDAAESRLYLWPMHVHQRDALLNSSGARGREVEVEVVAAGLSTLIRIQGAPGSPVANLTLRGLEFTETRSTFMERYEVPSGGDWSIHRAGAVFVQDAENVHVEACKFDQLGGNGVVWSNHVADSSVCDSELTRLGDSGVVSVGKANWLYGTKSTFPIRNKVVGNHIHDLGVYGKQTSCYFQAISAEAEIANNVCYNGPRSGINLNDGFFGRQQLHNNLIFNMVRETGDPIKGSHGPYNTWDRTPYITGNGVEDGYNEIQRGSPNGTSVLNAPAFVTSNFIINGHNGYWALDHDDGSQFCHDTHNVLAWGGYKNFLGHSKNCAHNLILYPGSDERSSGHHRCVTDDNNVFADQFFHDNTCITDDGSMYSFGKSSEGEFPGCGLHNISTTVFHTWNNTFYSPSAEFAGPCGTKDFQDWQHHGQDIGSVVLPTPTTQRIVEMAAQVLNMHVRGVRDMVLDDGNPGETVSGHRYLRIT